MWVWVFFNHVHGSQEVSSLRLEVQEVLNYLLSLLC